MKFFFYKLAYFIVFFLGLVLSILIIYIVIFNVKTNDIPALNFSNSYSFNEKIKFLKNQPRNTEILSVGSSMTLNNLNSEVVVNEMHNTQLLNAASWGMSMGDDYSYIKSLLSSFHNVKQIIIVSNAVDFLLPEKTIDNQFVEDYLSDNKSKTFQGFVRTFDLNYYITNLRYAKFVRSCHTNYENLIYDNYGAVLLDKDSLIIDSLRWRKHYLDRPSLNSQYHYLDSIAKYCGERNITLMLFHSPFRQGLYEKFNNEEQERLQLHIDKVKTILAANNQIFVDANDRLWPDTLFADALHFNDEGARSFTLYCFDKLKVQNAN